MLQGYRGRMEPLLIYDGSCGFCTSSARWPESRFRGPAHAVPWQKADLERLGIVKKK